MNWQATRDGISRADWVIDLGPGAGHGGGTVVFEGPPAVLVDAKGSVIGEQRRDSSGRPRCGYV